MSHRYYSLPKHFSSFTNSQLVDLILEKPKVILKSNRTRTNLDAFSKREYYKKIKFALGVIYFFSLIYFTVKLFT